MNHILPSVLPVLSICVLISILWAESGDWSGLNLYAEHLPYFFKNNPELMERCIQDPTCPYKDITSVRKCWGYEKGCLEKERMSMPVCDPKERSVNPRETNREIFWKQADFGVITERNKEYKYYCKPQHKDDSSLQCVDYMRYCRATNLYMDLRTAGIEQSSSRYREDLFVNRTIGGHCKLDQSRLRSQSEHKSPLQSWYAEMEHFSSIKYRPLKEGHCDIIIDKPTYLIKLDAGVNMFHHFCDFVNLYVSQHMNNSFSQDVNIVMWDTSGYYYGDFFSSTWKVFSDHPVIPLRKYDGKRVCFKEAIFSFLARQRLGLYYNMPLVYGCEGSGLMRAFSQHITHRLKIPQLGPLKNKIRITLLSRNTKYRNIVNQDELISELQKVKTYEVQLVEFNRDIEFLDQMKIIHNSDIFIGIHGAGLTHMLFQPDWAVVFEIYNCEDSRCYHDLARLRGIKYMTWEKPEKLDQEDEGHHPTLGAHAKFTNYGFDVKEFMRMVKIAADHVTSHPTYIAALKETFIHISKDEL